MREQEEAGGRRRRRMSLIISPESVRLQLARADLQLARARLGTHLQHGRHPLAPYLARRCARRLRSAGNARRRARRLLLRLPQRPPAQQHIGLNVSIIVILQLVQLPASRETLLIASKRRLPSQQGTSALSSERCAQSHTKMACAISHWCKRAEQSAGKPSVPKRLSLVCSSALAAASAAAFSR